MGPGVWLLLRFLLRAQFRDQKQGPFLVPIFGPRNCIFFQKSSVFFLQAGLVVFGPLEPV